MAAVPRDSRGAVHIVVNDVPARILGGTPGLLWEVPQGRTWGFMRSGNSSVRLKPYSAGLIIQWKWISQDSKP